MGPDQSDSEPQADNGKDPHSGRFLKGHKPYITRGNGSGLRGRPGKDNVHAWEEARSRKTEVIRALVLKAIKGHLPSIELYLAYVDGRPVQTFHTESLVMNVSAEDIKELSEKIEANRQAFLKELGIGAEQKAIVGVITGTTQEKIENLRNRSVDATHMPAVEIIADAARTPETQSS